MSIYDDISSSASRARRKKEYKKVKRVLNEMERQAAEAKANKYHVETCAICLERLFPLAAAEGVAGEGSDADADVPDGDVRIASGTRTLACGHVFHVECLRGWAAKATCPICRAPYEEAAAPDAEAATPAAAPLATWEREREYSFRLERSHYLYRDTFNDSLYRHYERRGLDAAGSLVADVAFVRAAPGYGASTRSSGNYSSGGGYSGGGGSFGGGSSGGGGGAGGSW